MEKELSTFRYNPLFEPTVSASVLIDADNHWGFNRKSISGTASESGRSTA